MAWKNTRQHPGAMAAHAARVLAALGAANRESAEDLKEELIRECPKSEDAPPGHVHLWETIDVEHLSENISQVTVGDEAHKYWSVIEFGSAHTAAHPFISRSFQTIRRARRARFERAARGVR
jgi:hypothetical protein